ncbi:MAG: class I SAM-dependent methyltransferase [Myxococcota bacterium]
MTETIGDTSERIQPGRQISVRQHLLYLRHQFAYGYVGRELRSVDRVLEVGCGAGYGATQLSDHAAQFVGLDVDPGVVEQASDAYASDACEFRIYDGVRIPFDDASFDVAVSFQVVEHVSDDLGLIAEIARVLAPGGVLYLTTPNRLTRVDPGRKPWNRYHLREYTPAELAALMHTAFADVRMLGVRATDVVEKIEHERLRSIRKIASIDVLGLRDRVPEWLKQWVARLVERREQPVEESLERFDVSDYRSSADELERSLDLLAVCRVGS